MAGALRKTMVYLGLAEDDRYDDDLYDEYEDDATARRDGRYDGPHGAHPAREQGTRDQAREHGVVREQGIREQGAQVTQMPQRSLARVVPSSPADDLQRITTIHPRTYNEAKNIGESFREGVPVIMNLTDMDDADAKRLVDFAAGLVFGLHGAIERVTNKVFLLSPAHIEVTAEDKEPVGASGLFNQS
jgi:cell division inhibitor SepF